eukprot:scaffold18368_cov40-Prasinocladus_malaysianus.AAC.1
MSDDLARAGAEVNVYQDVHTLSNLKTGSDSPVVVSIVGDYMEVADEVEGKRYGCFLMEHALMDVAEFCLQKHMTMRDPKATPAQRREAEHELMSILHVSAEALDEARKLDLLHFDIKPHNILLFVLADGTLAARLCDFGGSRSLSQADLGPDFRASWDKASCEAWVAYTLETVPPPQLLAMLPAYNHQVDAWGKALTILMTAGFLFDKSIRATFEKVKINLMNEAAMAPSFDHLWRAIYLWLKNGPCRHNSPVFCKVTAYHAATGLGEAVGKKALPQLSRAEIEAF